MTQRVGICSICGGDVVGYRGAWMAVIPPPPDQCSNCGATRKENVIEMVHLPIKNEKIGYVITDHT
jgi:hypothetical protein